MRPDEMTPRRSLVVVVHAGAGVRVGGDGISAEGADAKSLADILDRHAARLSPMLGVSEERVRHQASALQRVTADEVPDLTVFYSVDAPDDRLDALAAELLEHEAVDGAYVKPPAELPHVAVEFLEERWHDVNFTLSNTPDFTSRQGYLDPAPDGIDARHAWRMPGGRGAGVTIIDIETGWQFSHEDLRGGLLSGVENAADSSHGAAVQGIMCGRRNGFGVTGICSAANFLGASAQRPQPGGGTTWNTAPAIWDAANAASPGDIILIEQQRNWLPVEWWEDDFQSILYATQRGVIVVEAAANGGINLDDPTHSVPGPGFPSTWTNPFNRRNRDSGAIIVGAGNPPPGTHGNNYGPDRARALFNPPTPTTIASNFGSVVDAQGWGMEVTTCGYGDLQPGGAMPAGNGDLWYTDSFIGTSAAAPIVAGAVACVQGMLAARGRKKLSSLGMRALLRDTGTPPPAGSAIGNRPDLLAIVKRLFGTSVPQQSVDILFGVTQDGGGIVIVGGKPVPIPPLDPGVRDIVTGLMIHQFSAQVGHGTGRALQRQALELVAELAQQKAHELQ